MGRRAREAGLRLIIRPDNVRAGMVMHRAVAIMSTSILRSIGVSHRHLVASIWVGGMLKLIGAHSCRTHRGANRRVRHGDREDSGHDPRNPDAPWSFATHLEMARIILPWRRCLAGNITDVLDRQFVADSADSLLRKVCLAGS